MKKNNKLKIINELIILIKKMIMNKVNKLKNIQKIMKLMKKTKIMSLIPICNQLIINK